MTWRGFWLRIAFAVLVIILVIGTIFFMVQQSNSCKASGGTLVRGVSSAYVCVGGHK